MSAVVKGDAMDARVYFDDPYKTMAPPTDKYGEALAHAESARHGIYPMATDWKGHRQIIDILAEALTKMAAQLIETQGHLIRRNAELAETLCAPSAEPQMDDWDVAITEMCHQLGMNADYDKGFAEGWCAAMKEAESKYVNREPDGWAVTQPDGTSSPRGFWFVGCYLDKKMAEQIVRKVAQGAEAKPIYFAPSSTCEGGEGGEGS